ncbi:MAG: DUF255 domain-containing protein [Phycisphaerales bacterium]|nr:DUF255 domain-containing protein [Phycisphaerales bacterium]
MAIPAIFPLLAAIFLAQDAQMPPTPPSDTHTNRLAAESIPYLLQHAHNPVDWYPWGEEAFAEARRRGVPIFLSVGYATCYWCHVMERESFENETVAKVLNEHFVCIKVDREQRPDIDDIYMQAVQLYTQGHGGWPMSVWLTPPGARSDDDPGLEPFFAGTYFPPVDDPRFQRPGFANLCANISAAWKDKRDEVLKQAEQTTALIREQLAAETEPVRIDETQLAEGVQTLLRIYDADNGGFGGGTTKFPQPVYLDFLMTVAPGIDDPAARNAVDNAIRRTLDKMALGGINDHLAGGFHRYSVDPRWEVPHFEKMLYDNAQLATTYATRYLQTGDQLDARVVRNTLDYVLREMTDSKGGFYSAQDAEAQHREGLTFLWTPEEVRAVLGDDDGAFACRVYSLDKTANFRDPHHPDDPPSHVLVMGARPDELARREGMSTDKFYARLDAVNDALHAHRKRRPQPTTDDKVLAGWNGLMIGAMSDGARALGDEKYLDAAEKAARFVMGSMRTEGGGLMRVWRAGTLRTSAFLEDYAFLAQGLCALAQAEKASGRDADWAKKSADWCISRAFIEFGAGNGALFDTREGQVDLLVRTRSVYDGAVPSASGVMIHALMDMHDLTGEAPYLDRARSVLASMSGAIKASPVGSINATRALARVMRTDPGFPDSLGAPDAGPLVLDKAPVEVFAPGERITVTRERWAALEIELRIADGFHINAVDPGVEGMIGLGVRIEGGAGVEMELDAPAAHAYTGGVLPPPREGEGPLMVYEGTVRLTIRLRRTDDEWRGNPIIVMTYQACTDDACLAPEQIELDVALDPAL